MPIENQVTVIEARNFISNKKKDIFLLNVSDTEENDTFLEPFTSIPLNELGQRIPSMQTNLVTLIICEDGEKSIKAQQLLHACGQKAYAIRGGMKDWRRIIIQD